MSTSRNDGLSVRQLVKSFPVEATIPSKQTVMASSATKALKYITVPATRKHTATVIFLHGLGDSGAGWEPVAKLISRAKEAQHIKWILPHAPQAPVSWNGGYVMPTWFDIFTLDGPRDQRKEDEEGMLKAVSSINALISAEVDESDIPSNRIVVGGFSQGGALAFLTGLTSERKLGGIVALSTWLPLNKKMKAMMSDHARKLPIFMGHGSADPVVQYADGKASAEWLASEGKIRTVPSESRHPQEENDLQGLRGLLFETYQGMAHSSSPEELVDVREWLLRVLPPDDEKVDFASLPKLGWA